MADEATEVGGAPAPVAPASSAPPRTIVIIDESLASYEGEQAATDQAGSDQASADGQATADDWAAADAATEEATVAEPATNPPAARDNLIVIVDDTAYDDTA